MRYRSRFLPSVKTADESFDGSLMEGFREKCLIYSIFNTYIHINY